MATAMVSIESSVPSPGTRDIDPAHFFLVRGRHDILRLQPVLATLSTVCGQTGAMDYLEYFLTMTENLKKIPYLVLVASRSDADVFRLEAGDLRCAALVYEYKLFGLSSGVFSSSDFNGNRATIAAADERVKLSTMACRFLMDQGARAVMLSFAVSGGESSEDFLDYARAGKKKRWWSSQTREVGATILLQKSFDETLATLGSETRRNLRRYRRKAEEELGCSFAGDLNETLTLSELIDLNRASTHPVADVLLERRHGMIRSLEGSFCVGVRQAGGQWISLLGGRRHHRVTEIDWQLNRSGLAKYSVGTVMRAYVLEHETGLETERLFFEGGTPHTMRHSFVSETAVDLIAVKNSPLPLLLRRMCLWLGPGRNFLLQTLADRKLVWKLI